MLGWLFGEAKHGKPVRTQLARARPTAIAHCRDGERQRVAGIVEGETALRGPVSGRPCIFWLVTIDEVGHGDWIERGVTEAGAPFQLRDDSGLASVHPGGARCDLRALSQTFASNALLGAGPSHLFRTLGITLNYPHTSKVRFNERIITTGMKITVLGHNQHEPMQEASAAEPAGYRGELPMRPVFSSSRRKPLLIGDA